MAKARLKSTRNSYLDGQLLVAMPGMSDKYFARSVIYMCAHSAEGAMGLIINQRAGNITFPDLLEQLGIVEGNADEIVPVDLLDSAIHVGGPVETARGFVLHSPDYFSAESTKPIDGRVSLTATIDILKAMASGDGPHQAILALGYAAWAPGQLEGEIQANGWLNCPADPDVVFATDLEDKYERALSLIGIDPPFLVNACGHC